MIRSDQGLRFIHTGWSATILLLSEKQQKSGKKIFNFYYGLCSLFSPFLSILLSSTLSNIYIYINFFTAVHSFISINIYFISFLFNKKNSLLHKKLTIIWKILGEKKINEIFFWKVKYCGCQVVRKVLNYLTYK